LSLTRRGKATVAATVVVVLALGAGGYFAVFPNKAPAFVRSAMSRVGLARPAPPTCPLTGLRAPHGRIPDRPALAIKVENLPEARPQAGLDQADIVYEEPVEGGITRFIVVFQCHESRRVGPVRSGRTTDPAVLVQFGRPVMGYAGGVDSVVHAIDRAGVIDENYLVAVDAYWRDPNRSAPHNLYTSTKALWKAGKSREGTPGAVFTYDDHIQSRSRRVGTVHLDFSSYSDVFWTWSPRAGAWLRSHGTVPHTLEDGSRVSAANVVVMRVQVHAGSIHDAAGNPSPVVNLTGSGKAYVFRNGRMIPGRWQRPSLKDLTTFVTRDGQTIALAPGVSWVELLPSTIRVQVAR
jgi:hypothetical protein